MGIGVIAFLLIIFVGSVVMFINSYNGLVQLRAQLERAWANIDVVLKQRFDEIPQLVQVIEQFTGYEAGILKDLVAARTRYGSANTVAEKIDASHGISNALRGVLAIGESYPELKSNQNFVQLQTRISALESTIADRRESYNEAVANFNARIEQFPDSIAAGMLRYQRQQMFQVADQERTAPNLKMNLPKIGA